MFRQAKAKRADMSLSDCELERYARHIILPEIGAMGQLQLKKAHMIVIGAGGIGCPAIQYLAAGGIGTLTIIDDDHVSLSNLQRQTLFSESQQGMAKVLAAQDAVARINPHVTVQAVQQRITGDTVSALIQNADVVLDGCDNFATRLLVSDHSVKARIPLVSAAIGKFQGQIGTFYGWRADAPCYRCFVGDAHDADDCDTCADVGVLGAMCGLMGSFAAMEAIRVVTRFGADRAGRLQIFDGLAPEMRSIRLPKDPACSGCKDAPE
jgi:molybdopterin-synthase adenylyltransferase